MTRVYPNEAPLFRICAVISCAFWLVLIVGTLGVALLYVGIGMLLALFTQAAFISYLKGTGVRVSREQLPELDEQVQRCCRSLGIADPPDVYVLNANGVLNALAARFLRRHYVVLYSDVIDALRERPGALAFYIGHELGHIARGHLAWGPVLWPARGLPLLGAAYARAREYTCDLHGLACCTDPADALFGASVLAAGGHAAQQLDVARYAAQSESSGGFWMSFHELVGDYPWLTKRVHRLISASHGETSALPRRHWLAWPLAFFVPHLGGGSAAAVPLAAVVMVVGIVAAIAIPNFIKFQVRAKAGQIGLLRHELQQNADGYIRKHGRMPPDLESLGMSQPSGGMVSAIEVGSDGFSLVVSSPNDSVLGKKIALTPYVDSGQLRWRCGDEELAATFRTVICGAEEEAPAPARAAPAEGVRAPARPRAAEAAAPAAPEPAAESPTDESPALLGRWQPLSEGGASYRLIVLGAGHSAIVTLADGTKALGTFEFDGQTVKMEISTPSGEVSARYQAATSGGRTLLRPLAGGPFYAKN